MKGQILFDDLDHMEGRKRREKVENCQSRQTSVAYPPLKDYNKKRLLNIRLPGLSDVWR